MDPNQLIAALGVLADPNASDEDKAAALDTLSAYFNSLLDSQAAPAAAAAAAPAAEPASASAAAASDPPEAASAAGDGEDKAKEMASALSTAVEMVKTLTARVSKMEKASAVGLAPRRAAPTVLPRVEPVVQKDHIVSMIEAAERNTLRNLSK